MIRLEQLLHRDASICVVGLGYVGLPLAILLSKHFSVVGFDINVERIEALQQGIDTTKEVSGDALRSSSLTYTHDPACIQGARFIIVAVPTPITPDKAPDLRIVEAASRMVGKHIQKDTIVVYESTVYPGVTEDICVPIIAQESGLTYGTEFAVGYSPERVNPGDTEHTIDRVVKVVSGMNEETRDVVAGVYGAITSVFRASSIKVAEAAKVIENTQRDVNIALMNELALIFERMNISVYDVLAAAKTKWNFLPFEPGLVGGHCIGVDPYYLTYKAQELGYEPDVILAGRGINDRIPVVIAETLLDRLIQLGKDPKTSTAVIWGVTFKENIPDIRNSKVADMYRKLVEHGMRVFVYDPEASSNEVMHEYGFSLTPKEQLPQADLLIVAVGHSEFRAYEDTYIKECVVDSGSVVADIKHIYDRSCIERLGIHYWSL